MKNTVTFDDEMRAQWQKAFRLDYCWGKKVPSIIAATLALGILNDTTPSGYYLARQKLGVQNLPLLGQELTLRAETTKKLRSCICKSDVQSGGKTEISLLSVLIKPELEPVTSNPKLPATTDAHGDLQYWRMFTPDEVKAFASLSGDTNNIHSGNNPVVQGMLILLALEDYLALDNLFFGNVDINYLRPVRTNKPVKLLKEDNTLYGLVDGSVSFKLSF